MQAISFSAHKVDTIRLTLPIPPAPRRNGYWQLRAHILSNEILEELKIQRKRGTRQKRFYNTWMKWWVECAKPEIKSFFDGKQMKNTTTFACIKMSFKNS